VRRNEVSRFVESLLAGRRPRGFRAGKDDAALIRTAIHLKAHDPDDGPSEEFTSGLFDELAAAQSGGKGGIVHQLRWPNGLAWMPAAAAAVALVVATAAVTDAVSHGSSPAAVARYKGLRDLALVDRTNHGVGTLNLYQGTPSWVFMSLHVASYSGPVTCQLIATNGTVLMNGMFAMTAGSGEWARTISSNTAQVSGARVVTPAGVTLASAGLGPA
jgi:hypothetical protein